MKIICYSSYTATWFFAFAEAIIALELQKKGHDVVYITPGKLFKRISNIKQEVILRKEFGLKGYELGTTLNKDDYKKINLLIKDLNKTNFEKLVINDVQIGKIALYEFLLHNKKMSSKLTDTEWKECLRYLKYTLISFFACRKIIKTEKPDRILLYSTLYSVNHVWERYAKHKGIPVYFMQNGANLSDTNNTLIIAKNNPFYYMDILKINWSKIKNIPVSQKTLSYVTDNFMELIKAKHFSVYSTPKSKEYVDIKNIFNIKKNQKILTVTMSSYDEVFAAQYVGAWKMPKSLIFKSQLEWIKALINYVKNQKDKFLIIRVHPREFPNQRESMKSTHAKILEKVFKNLPNNVKVNWPADKISIYDLAQETDVFLNAWSTAGVEISMLGIPVVTYAKELALYPSELNYMGVSQKDYFTKIESALVNGWSYEKIKMTYRWLALYYQRTIVTLRNNNTNSKLSIFNKFVFNTTNYCYRLLSPKVRASLIKVYYMIPGLGIGQRQINDCRRQLVEHADISRVVRMLEKSGDTLVDIKEILKSKVSRKVEDDYIRHEVKRIYNALYGTLPKGTKIKKDSLQYNLKQIVSLK